MGFPDRIERVVEIDRPPAAVWTALTSADGLAAWFGQRAAIDLRPGGTASMSWDGGHGVEMRVERVEEPSVFAFTWPLEHLPADDPRRTYVEFTLEPTDGGTRLTVVETGFAQLPDAEHRIEHDSHVQGWASELGELVEHLRAA
ncbi:SRPBCC domain-containing protein [Pseudonocardia abyssalis]|uniref:SRPBCC domain-containing protein n=1 Tax=Pseudonocardia abyssalis TaxID=2792008 RepID=A0ABS6UMP6_9PSEU|nr:SRPBCC domain-containing protein [Pseudonocardia abyssalis]MBW0116346.1 SRPBCC domain-containing protein [Pseudonocardia abyssalis]MBW0133522.1 SRPBCC domain-containing protein [Pseudonocardia abyssalis]